jgi:type II secretion system protein N
MSFLQKKALWFTVYGIFITIAFLYLLFPGELIKSRLENSINSAQFAVHSSSLHASFPLGLKLKNVTISSASPANVFFQGEALDAQFNLSSLFRRRTYIGLSGKAYGGSFNGTVGILSLDQAYPPAEAKLNFKNIDLEKYTFIKDKLGRAITGKARGVINYNTDEAGKITTGALNLFLSKGAYLLAESFLGINKIDFENGDIQAEFVNGSIKLQKLEISGPQINCLLKGEITPQADFINSRISLAGTMEIRGKDNVKMKITIGGTLANPVMRYI